MHRKKILAVAVAGALGMGSAGVALAAGGAGESNYAIYGKLYPQVSSYDYSGATRSDPGNSLVGPVAATADHTQRSTLDVNNSRIGFRGREKLGGNLTAIFQIESRVRFDTGTGTWAGGRNSFIGLTGSVGTFKLGNMDTAYKEAGDTLSFLGVSSGNIVSNSNLLSQGGDADTIDFHIRQQNAIMYESPELMGARFLATWGKDEFKGNPGRNVNVLLNSYALTFERGPLYAALAREIHHDFFAGSNSFGLVENPTDGSDVRSNDNATRATVKVKFGNTTAEVNVAQLELKETGAIATGNFTGYKSRRFSVGVQQKFGNITGQVALVNADKGTCTLQNVGSCDSSNLEARVMNLGANYAFSRRTQVFALYSKLTNGSLANFSNVSINPSAATDPQRGEDVTAIGVGVNHNF